MISQRFTLNAMCRPIEVFNHWQKEGFLDLSPPYQRGDVWGLKRRRNLIRSLTIGIPIPSLIISDRFGETTSTYSNDEEFKFAVIDGKQRITSILLFLSGGFKVPGEWFGLDAESVAFGDLPEPTKRRFKNRGICTHEGRFRSIQDELVVFELVNFGGLAQGEIDSDVIELA